MKSASGLWPASAAAQVSLTRLKRSSGLRLSCSDSQPAQQVGV